MRRSCFLRCARKHRKLRGKMACHACFQWFCLLLGFSGGSLGGSGATKKMPLGAPSHVFWCSFGSRPARSSFWDAPGTKNADLDLPRGSEFVLSPRRRANFQKMTSFLLESFLARLGSPWGTHFGPFLGLEGRLGGHLGIKFAERGSKKAPTGKPRENTKRHEKIKIEQKLKKNDRSLPKGPQKLQEEPRRAPKPPKYRYKLSHPCSEYAFSHVYT